MSSLRFLQPLVQVQHLSAHDRQTSDLIDHWDQKFHTKYICPRQIFAFRHKMNSGKCFMCLGKGKIMLGQKLALERGDARGKRLALAKRSGAISEIYTDDQRMTERRLQALSGRLRCLKRTRLAAITWTRSLKPCG